MLFHCAAHSGCEKPAYPDLDSLVLHWQQAHSMETVGRYLILPRTPADSVRDAESPPMPQAPAPRPPATPVWSTK